VKLDDDRAALIEMERQLLGYCEIPQIKAILLRVIRILLKNHAIKD
jgi:hypothetical protein